MNQDSGSLPIGLYKVIVKLGIKQDICNVPVSLLEYMMCIYIYIIININCTNRHYTTCILLCIINNIRTYIIHRVDHTVIVHITVVFFYHPEKPLGRGRGTWILLIHCRLWRSWSCTLFNHPVIGSSAAACHCQSKDTKRKLLGNRVTLSYFKQEFWVSSHFHYSKGRGCVFSLVICACLIFPSKPCVQMSHVSVS